MIKKILLPFDGLEQTMKSARYALKLAKILDSELYIAHIINSKALSSVIKCTGKSIKEAKDYCMKRLGGIFDELKREAKKQGLKKYFTEFVFSEHIEKGILEFASKKNIDLCLIQPSPYQHSELTGDLASRISKMLKCDCLYVKTSKELKDYPIILAPFDEKKNNMKSVFKSIEIASKTKGKVIFYHTTWKKEGINPEDNKKHCENSVLENIKKAESLAIEKGLKFEIIIETEDTIQKGIIKTAVLKEADIIIMSKSNSIVGGLPTLVLNNSMYPLMVIK